MLLRSAINLIRKDWFQQKKLILLLTTAMFFPLVILGDRSDFAKGMTVGIIVGAAYGYAHFCFAVERQTGTLTLLLALPVRPLQLVLVKYASLYSMVLFTANFPGLFLRDRRLLLLTNAAVVFLSTLSMAGSVISAKPWASMLPFWGVFIFVAPIQKLLEDHYPDALGVYVFFRSHVTVLAFVALAIAPVIAFLSALCFHKRST